MISLFVNYAFFLYKNPHFRIINNFVLGSMISAIILAIIEMFQDAEVFISYGVTTALTIFVVAMNCTMRALMHRALNLQKFAERNFWSLHFADHRTFLKIKKSCQIGKILLFIVQGIITYLGFTPSLKDGAKFYFEYKFIIKHFGSYTNLFLSISTAMIVFGGFTVNVALPVTLFGAINIASQFRLLNFYVCHKLSKKSDGRASDRDVENDLLLCIIEHQNITKFTQEFTVIINRLFSVALFGTGFTIIVCIMCNFLTTHSINYFGRTSMVLLVVVSGFILFGVVYYIQELTDEVSSFGLNLQRCDWYRWNIRNQKLFLMLTMASNYFDKPIHLFGTWKLENAILVKVIQFLFSVYTFLENVTTTKK